MRVSSVLKGFTVRKSVFASILLAPSLALASGYSLPNTNPRDLSMCASSVAAQRDSGAAFALPAALARMEGPSAGASFGIVHVFNTWKDPSTGQKVSMDTTFSPLGTLNVSYGGKVPFLGNRGVGVGVGFQPFGGAIVSWPAGWPGRYRILEVDRKVFSGVATVGVELHPQVRVGGGFVYYYTWEKLSQNAWMAPFTGAGPGSPGTWNPATPDATGTIDLSGGAPSYDLSAEIDPVKGLPLTIGVDYKHKATQTLDGDVSWSGLTPIAQTLSTSLAPIFANQKAKQRLTIPNVLNVGAAYRVARPLLVTATFTFDRWVVYDEDRFVGANGAYIAVPRHYRNGQTYRAGVEYDLLADFQVRVGIERDVSGLRSQYASPTLPDASSWAGSLGASYRLGRGFHLDAAVFYAMMDKVTVPSSAAGLEPPQSATVGSLVPTGTFRGEYTPSALVYTVGLGWKPGER